MKWAKSIFSTVKRRIRSYSTVEFMTAVLYIVASKPSPPKT